MKKLGIGLLVLVAIFTIGSLSANEAKGPVSSNANALASTTPQAAQTSTSEAPSVQSGPLTTVGDGDFEVGVDMAAGKYKTQGPEDEGDSCYYEVHDESGDFKGIKKNGNLSGPGNVTLKKGDYFKSGQGFTKGCVWTKVA